LYLLVLFILNYRSVYCFHIILFFYRTRHTVEAKYKLTVEELSLFYEQIESLPCTIKEGEGVKELLDRVKDFQKEAAELLNQEMPESQLVDKCIENGVVLDIELPEIPKLKQVICIPFCFCCLGV
jgi:histone demethylase JARID1